MASQGANKDEWSGIDPRLLASIAKKIPSNPVTGKTDLSDVMNYMSKHPEKMAKIMGELGDSSVTHNLGSDEPFNVDHLQQTLKYVKDIHPGSFWVAQTEDMGPVDSSGYPSSDAQGARNMSIIYVYDEKGCYRTTLEVIGDIKPDHLIRAIYQAITAPVPPLKQALPNLLMVSLRFKQLETQLRKWLGIYPAPFSWRFETEQESRTVASGISDLNEKGFAVYYARSNEFKQRGNEAFKRKDRNSAVEAYTKAVEDLENALNLADLEVDSESQAEVQKSLAVCYANRAAAWCIEGPGMNAKKAVEDGLMSEKMDNSYAKAYYRQAKAHILLKQKSKAEGVLIRALSLPELQDDNSLVDFLIELQTNGKGLSQDEGAFKQWMLDLTMNGVNSGKPSPINLKGEWKRRCDVLFEKFNKERDGGS